MLVKQIIALGWALFAIDWGVAPAHAHSWYPHECCNGHDCGPADRVETLPDGRMRIHVGNLWADTPRGFASRPSKDGAAHACIIVDENGERQVRCLFLPPES